ncbi:MAG: PA14 domain-containing protein [Acidobacteriota bacterium]|nr:PA14 domain-containing protein [Acidobacteriota bacterium]
MAGHLVISRTEGADPNHRLVVRHALGQGIWDSAESVYFKGLNVPPADYVFNNGSQTSAPISTFFTTDKQPHTGAVIIDVKAPVGVGEADTEKTEPTGFAGIFKTGQFPNFNSTGQQITPDTSAFVNEITAPVNFTDAFVGYTASPARAAAGWLLGLGGIARTRINWAKWTAWRDYLASTETVDYTTIAGFDGIGLTARYYNGTNFQTFLVERIDPILQFNLSDGAPAVGVPANSFSVRWEGKIKPAFTETYTFKIIHDNGARLWVNGVLIIGTLGTITTTWNDDGLSAARTDTGTFAATANTFYTIKAEWNEGGGPGEFQLLWSSPSLPEEIVPAEVLYPLPRALPRYEAHVAFSTPTTVEGMLSAVLRVSNSIVQDVNGKLEFYCVEQLVPTFDFDETLPENERQIIRSRTEDGLSVSSLRINTIDRRVSEQQNVFEAKFRDLDSQFLEEPIKPVQIKVQSLITEAGREISGGAVELYNMTRWQANKCLAYIVGRIIKTETVTFSATARAYSVIAGDLVRLKNLGGRFNFTTFQVVEAVDASPQASARERQFTLKEW